MLLKDFPPWQTVYWWFRRFVRRLLFRTIHDVALMLDREREARELRLLSVSKPYPPLALSKEALECGQPVFPKQQPTIFAMECLVFRAKGRALLS